MAKNKSSKNSGCLPGVIGVVALAGYVEVSSFFGEHKKEALIVGAGIAVLLIAIIIMKNMKRNDEMDEQLARYKPTTLLPYYQLSESEIVLMKRALLFLGDGKFIFEPHDVGVAGDNVSSNYYSTLINKGYLDRPKRGHYSINPVHLKRALDQYNDTIAKKIEDTKKVVKESHFDLAERSRKSYQNELKGIRIDLEDAISVKRIEQYLIESGSMDDISEF